MPRPQRLLSFSLAAAYAALGLFGHTLHQHAPLAEASIRGSGQAESSCGHGCCQHRVAVGDRSDDRAPLGWSRANSSTGHDPNACAACRAMAQLKLGKASPPPGLPIGWVVLPKRVASDHRIESSPAAAPTARGPPSPFATV